MARTFDAQMRVFGEPIRDQGQGRGQQDGHIAQDVHSVSALGHADAQMTREHDVELALCMEHEFRQVARRAVSAGTL